MRELGPLTYEAFVSAVSRKPYNRKLYELACEILKSGAWVMPDGMSIDREIPSSLAEWRKDPQWSIDFANRHQKAAEAAWLEFWRVKTLNQKGVQP